MNISLEHIVLPPAVPRVQAARDIAIGELAWRVALAAISFALAATALGWLAIAALQRGAFLAALLLAAVVMAIYIGIGATLCAMFLRRLRLWAGATLHTVVLAKRNFVLAWPWTATRLLWLLLVNKATGQVSFDHSSPGPYSAA